MINVLRENCVDCVKLDGRFDAGYTGVRISAGMAEAAGIPCVHHSFFQLGISLAGSLHVMASCPNFTLASSWGEYGKMIDDVIIGGPLKMKTVPYLEIPTAPGIGVELDRDKLALYHSFYQKEIYEKGQIPILVGGTGFYIQAVLYDIDFTSEREDTAYREQLEQLAKEHGAEYPSASLKDGGAATIDDFCTIILEEANAEGVRGEVVFEQAMLETGWLQYGGDSGISQYNFAGIGTTGGGVAGVSYPDVRTGIRAQVQHLKAYACEDALNQDLVDTRFDMVTRGSAPYVEWLGQQENPNGGGWAAGSNYGEKLRKLLSDLKAE